MRAPETPLERATRLQYQAWLSEKNRTVKLENRADAPQRIASAAAKRARRAKVAREAALRAENGVLRALILRGSV